MSGFVKSFFAATMPIFPLLTMFTLPRSDHFGSSLKSHVQFRDSWDSEYDYIIVGGGSAGAVLANRLSEDQHIKVLLLEAGGTENMISDIPLAFESLQQTPMDWAYLTEPQKAACFGHKGRVSATHTNQYH